MDTRDAVLSLGILLVLSLALLVVPVILRPALLVALFGSALSLTLDFLTQARSRTFLIQRPDGAFVADPARTGGALYTRHAPHAWRYPSQQAAQEDAFADERIVPVGREW